MSLFETEIKAFEARRSELVKDSLGKWAIFLGEECGGVFDTYQDALQVGLDKYGSKQFLIKEVTQFDIPIHFFHGIA